MTRTITYIGILFLLFACEKKVQEPSILLADVDDEFKIEMWEVLGKESRSLSLLLETIQEQDCENQFVKAGLEKQGSNFILNIEEITEPQQEECIANKISAKGDSDFGEVDGGVYELQINLKAEVINKGKLLVSPEKYEIVMDSDFGFFLPHPTLHRIPEGTIWGYISYDKQADENIASDFIRRLADFTVPINLEKGYYGYFELREQLELQEMPEEAHWAVFILRSKEQTVPIRKTVNQFRNTYPNQITIRMWTSEGEKI